MRNTAWLVLAMPMLAACASNPETGVVSGVEILEFGIEVQDENSSDHGIILEKTSSIPFKKGTGFGIKYRALGEPDGSSVNLKLLWITTPKSSTTRQARSRSFMMRRSIKVGGIYYMKTSTDRDGDMRRPYREKFIIGDDDGTVYAEMDFWIVDEEDD